MPLINLPSGPLCHDYASFTDETGLSESYLIIGGVSCRSDFAEYIHSAVARIQAGHPFKGSLQWKSLTPLRLPAYRALIDEFLEWNQEHLVDFHAVVIDRSRLRNHEFNDGDRARAFNKFLYQSLMSMHRRYQGVETLRCFHGNMESPYDLEDLRKMLNNTVTGAEWGVRGPYREVKYMEVRSAGPLQLADILLGIVGSYWNTRKPITNPAKIELAKYLHSECPADSLRRKTPIKMEHFDLWEFKLK